VVRNFAREPVGIHWHGIELESWSDGVAGWSGQGGMVAPAIAPGDSFTARLSLPRAGTFIYHTHLNDIDQVINGAIGPMVVLEPGQAYDPARDHVYLSGWNGPPTRAGIGLQVNGDSSSSPSRELAAGVTHRFRLLNLGPANSVRYELRRDTTLAHWQALARDGADLPPALRVVQPARRSVAVGQTFDFALTPEPGVFELTAAFGVQPPMWRQRLVFR
jgi:FtsP/CotA-like multicopper oxidase with cupredoxin domain